MASAHTLAETERQVDSKLSGMGIDFAALAVSSNLFRAANAVRNYLERTVLYPHGLSWTAFVVLWVVWIWEPIETRQIAEEGGFSKATLTGVLKTLESKGLAKRKRSTIDKRLVLVSLTPKGRKLMEQLFPIFNQHEAEVAGSLSVKEQQAAAEALRKMTSRLEALED